MIVVGGGAVGLCVAEALTSRGAEVTVFELDRCGAGASAGNAGWITPSLAIPVPAPGVIGASLRWLVNPSGPLWIRPTLSPAMLAWIAGFVASCRRPAYRRGLAALQQAGALAGPAFDRLAGRGVEFELHNAPLLYPAFDQPELEHLERMADELVQAGAAPLLERISAAEIRTVEPALSERVIGGLIAREDRRVRPESLCEGVRRALVAGGGEVLERSPVDAVGRDGSGWIVASGSARRRGDAIVLAAGVASADLLARLGAGLPIVAAKGYSRTYRSDPTGPRHAMYLETPKVAISAYDGAVRVSGTLELGAQGLSLSDRRLRAITAAAQQALPGWRMPSGPRDWAGMRSLSPDGLPFIGSVHGLDGLHVAAGHGTLGITLAPLTGELVADLVMEKRGSGALAAFDPGRAIGLRGYFKRPRAMRGGPR
ncbi:MAG: FAD-dependent oxidoreductase [Solirubrobacterales bacterium]|nr:FAD-dependent oxidoreductase [Solirubrobacterales bacterium]